MIIKKAFTDGYEIFRIPGIIITDKGTVIVYYECRHGFSDWSGIDIGMRRSIDGEHFEERKILAYGNGKTMNNPVMFADKGEITLLYQEEYFRTFMSKSYDDGVSFTEPVEITDMLKINNYSHTVIATGPCHGIVRENGQYVVPIWLAKNENDRKSHHPSVISTIFSNDKGKHWQVGAIIEADFLVNPSETAIAECDGKLILNIRNENPEKRRAITVIDKDYNQFSPLRFADDLIDPICCGGMASYGDTLYFVNCKSETDRTNLTLFKSIDAGANWQEVKTISDSAGYSDIFINQDGTAFVFYESENDKYLSINIMKVQ